MERQKTKEKKKPKEAEKKGVNGMLACSELLGVSPLIIEIGLRILALACLAALDVGAEAGSNLTLAEKAPVVLERIVDSVGASRAL